MVKTIREFVDELKTLRREMYRKGENADPKLVASWLDRLVISLERVSPTLELMGVGLEQLAESETVLLREKKTKKKAKKRTRRAAKKTKKRTARKKRRRR